jgi:hypothetical protein
MRYYVQAVVADVQMPAHYGDEESTLNPFKMLLTFPVKLTRAFISRILWRYFIHDFTACSHFIVVGTLLFVGGISFGAITWIHNSNRDLLTPTGTGDACRCTAIARVSAVARSNSSRHPACSEDADTHGHAELTASAESQ